MNRIPDLVTISVLGCFFVSTASAQVSTMPKWEVGLSVGPSIYQGDLAPSALGSLKTIQPGVSLFGNRILNRFLALRTSLTLADLAGNDLKYSGQTWREERALQFKTSLFEVSETLVWDILGNNDNHYQTRFSPYLFAGVGYSFLRVRRDASRFNYSYFGTETAVSNGLTADLDHSIPRGVPVIPIGAGVRYSISSRWSVSLEWDYRFAFTDYLDGFSKVGDPSKNDHYYGLSIGVVYTFFKSRALKCPKNPR